MGSSPLNLDWIVVPLVRGETVLDVACGFGRWGCLVRANYWEAGLQAPPVVDGVDGYEPNIETAKSLGSVYRNVWHQMLPSPLGDQWDTVLACEFLEHLPPSDVDATLDLLEGAARKRVIVSTPNGPDFREGGDVPHDHEHGPNALEAHLSYVPRGKLRARGYRVLGAGFGPPQSRLGRVPGLRKLSRDLGSLSLHLPAIGAAIVAYKDVG